MIEHLTAEQIVQEAEQKAQTDTNLAIRRQMNRIYRVQDESNKYPILNRFNITERAIRRVLKLERRTDVMSPLEYAYSLEQERSTIVNQEV